MRRKRTDVWMGAAAGMAGGLAASWIMGLFHNFWAKSTGANLEVAKRSTELAAAAVSENVLGHELTKPQAETAGPAVHFAFGTVMGGVYGAFSALLPAVSSGAGVPFGVALWAGAHVWVVPALRLAESPLERPIVEEAGEFAAHLVYGLVTDGVRRGVLAVAGRRP